MPKYNFEKGNGDFDETKRLDDISETLKKLHPSGVSLEYTKGLVDVPDAGDIDEFGDFETTRNLVGKTNSMQETADLSVRNNGAYNNRKNIDDRFKERSGRGFGSYGGNNNNNDNRKIIMIIAIACVLVFFAFFFMSMNSTKRNDADKDNNISEGEISDIANSKNKHFGVVTDVKENKTIYFTDVSTEKNLIVTVKDSVKINKENKEINVSEVNKGDIILVEETEDKEINIEIDGIGFIKENISGAEFDFDNDTLKLANDSYKLLDYTVYTNKNEKIPSESIDEYDTITIKGNSSQVYSVNVTSYHGYVLIKNINEIKDGMISINNGEYKPLGEGKMAIPSGESTIKIKGSNIKEVSHTLNLKEKETKEITVELEEKPLEEKKCYLFIKSNVDNFSLYLNGTKTEYLGEPISVMHGNISIRVDKEGYKSFSKDITLGDDMNTVNIKLEPIIMGSISVVSTPKSVGVYIDGKLEGISPITITKPVGEYVLTAKKADYYDLTIPITIKEGNIEIPITLKEIE